MYKLQTTKKNLTVTIMSGQEYADWKRSSADRQLAAFKIMPPRWDTPGSFSDKQDGDKNQNPGRRARALDL